MSTIKHAVLTRQWTDNPSVVTAVVGWEEAEAYRISKNIDAKDFEHLLWMEQKLLEIKEKFVYRFVEFKGAVWVITNVERKENE